MRYTFSLLVTVTGKCVPILGVKLIVFVLRRTHLVTLEFHIKNTNT